MKTFKITRPVPKKTKRPAQEGKPQSRLIPSPISGIVPPVEHRFQPGVSGNPGGRPKMIGESLTKELSREIEAEVMENGKKVKIKCRVVDLMTKNQIAQALSGFPHSVSAFRAIREVVEPTADETGGSGQDLDRQFLREVAHALLTRQVPAEKQADVREV